jgi:hypothetical protein
LVATPHGLVAIETLTFGDLVLAQNETTGEIAAKPITDLIRPEPKPLYLLALRDASGETETFLATDDHPWRVEGNGWVETADLNKGDRIDTASGEDMVVLSVSLTQRVEQTFNLTVADWHTFLVGEDRAVVHNVACQLHMHHLLPREFRRQFARAGLDIQKFRIPLLQGEHTGRAGGIHGGVSREASWNGHWDRFFRDTVNPSAQQILDHLAQMRRQFGI